MHDHVLRKYFQTKCKNAGIKADYVDFWMGHHPTNASTYLNDSYFRPSLEENANEYRKAVSALQVFSKEENGETATEIQQLKEQLAQMQEWKRLIERTITDKEIIETEWKRAHLEYEQEAKKTKSQEEKT